MALAGIAATALLLVSCDEDTPVCPEYEVGAVEGYVQSAGVGVSVGIGARALEGPSNGAVVCRTQTDASGWYRMELPSALYRLEIDPSGGHVYSNDWRDTVRVTPHVQRYDLARGRVEITIGMPEELESVRFNLSLYGQGFDNEHQYAYVQDGTLEYVIPFAQPGDYYMRLSRSGVSGSFYLPGTWIRHEADTLMVGTDQITTYDIDYAASYASVSGSVTGAWQQVSGHRPQVEVYDESGPLLHAFGCDAEGDFTCDLLVPRDVRLMVENHGVDRWMGGESFEDAQVFALAPGDRLTGVSVVGSGIVVDLQYAGGTTYDGYSVLVLDEAGRAYHPYAAHGSPFEICNLPPGRYFIRMGGHCDGTDWVRQWYDGVDAFEDATAIDLDMGELREIGITLVHGGRIEGLILNTDDSPPGLVRCGLRDGQGSPLCPEGDEWHRIRDGEFSFSGLSDGDYYLAIELAANVPWWYPGSLNFSSATPITIQDHEAITDLIFRLPDPSEVQP